MTTGIHRASFSLVFIFCVVIAHALPPIVFVPGWSASRLHVSVNLTVDACPANCPCVTQFIFSAAQSPFWPASEDCIMQYMQLTWNETDNTIFPTLGDGVTASFPDSEWGSTACSPDYIILYASLTLNGYASNKSLYAACWDLRTAPHHSAIVDFDWTSRMQSLVERACHSNNNTPVLLLAHSSGPFMTLYFLNQMSPEWKSKYILGFVALSGDFGGQGTFVMSALTGMSIGSSDGWRVGNGKYTEAWSGSMWQMPLQPFYGKQPIVVWGNLTFTASDFHKLLGTASPIALRLLERFSGTTGASIKAPLVDTWCWCGSNLSTMIGYQWNASSDLHQAPSSTINVMGDGNQEAQTNSACRVWQDSKSGFAFEYREFPNVEHFAMTLNSEVLNELMKVIRSL
jgi:hypothetical protein